MAESDKITTSQLIEDRIFQQQIKDAKEFAAASQLVVVGLKEIYKANLEVLKVKSPLDAKNIKEQSDALIKAENVRKAIIATEQKQLQVERELIKNGTEQLRQDRELLKNSKQRQSDQDKEIRLQQKQNSEYQKTSAALLDVKKQIKDLVVAGKPVSDDLAKRFKELDTVIRKADQGVGDFGRSVGNYPKQLKEMQLALTQLKPGTEEFERLSKEAGSLKDKIGDAKDSIKAFSSESKLTQGKTLISQIGSDLTDLNFGDASDKAKQFAMVVKSITFGEVIKGIKDFGSAILGVGKALLLNPFVLIASGIAAITYLIFDQIEAEKNLAIEQKKAHDERIKQLLEEQDAQRSYEKELNRARGGTTEEVYKRERQFILEDIALNRQRMKTKAIHSTEYYANDKKLFNDLILLQVKREAEIEKEQEKKLEQKKKDDAKTLADLKELRKAQGEYEAKVAKDKEQQQLNEFRIAEHNYDDLLKLRKKEAEDLAGFRKAEADYDVKIAKEKQEAEIKRVQDVIANEQKILQAIQDALDKENQAREQALDAQISQREKAISRQFELAKEGQSNQYAFEQAELAKDQLKKKELLKKEAREKEAIQLAQAYLSAYNAELGKAGANPSTAAALALKDVLLAKEIGQSVAALASFFDGTEDTGNGGNVDNKGGFVSILHPNERVMTAEQNKKIGASKLSNDKLTDIAVKYNTGQLIDISPKYNLERQASFGENVAASIQTQQYNEMNKLLKTIAEKPWQQIDIAPLHNRLDIIETIYKNNVKEIITHKGRARI